MTEENITPGCFGQYQVVKALGAGMQGETYLALDPAGNQVAIKTISWDRAADRKAARALNTEVAAIKAAPAVFVPEFFSHDPCPADIRPYFVMEYIEGPTLDEVLAEKGRLNDVELRRLAVRLSSVLAALHGAGVAHGDFRGQNIIVGDGGVYLIDFGRAVLRGDSYPEFRRCRARDLIRLGILIVLAGTGSSPYGEDWSRAIEHYRERKLELGGLSGRMRRVAHQLLRERRLECLRPSAKRVHHILVRGHRMRWRFWSGMFLLVPLMTGAGGAMALDQPARSRALGVYVCAPLQDRGR